MTMTLDEYGSSAVVAACVRYLDGWRLGKKGKPILLHGEPGVGKTTLVQVLAEHYGYELVENNASMDFSDESGEMAYAVSRKPLGAEHAIVFFDEVDNLTAKQQGELATVVRIAKEPTFLACNDISAVGPALRFACMTVGVPLPIQPRLLAYGRRLGINSVIGARSYRDVEALARGGSIGKPPDELRKRIEGVLRGHFAPEVIHSSEFWAVSAWIADNVGPREAARFDAFLRTGRWGHKYLHAALRGFQVKTVRFPWSVGVGRESERAPTRVAGPAKAPGAREGPKETPKRPSPAPRAAEDFFA